MTALPPLRDILNNTPATATDVDFNFNTIEAHIGSELINRDGSVAMTGPLLLAGPPTANNHAASKAYVDGNVVPVGVIWEYAGNVAPTGWAFCDGSSKSTTDPAYAALFAVIGYRHGGSGANFNLPDRRGRVPIGYQAGDALFGTLGARAGSRDAALVSHQHGMANHQHLNGDHVHNAYHGHSASSGGESADHIHAVGIVTDAQGDHSHTFPLRQTATVGTDVAQQATAAGTVGSMATNNAGTHAHNVIGNTGGRNVAHTHAITVDANNFNTGGATPAWSGTPNNNTTDAAGGAATNANLQPYEVVNFIIRIG